MTATVTEDRVSRVLGEGVVITEGGYFKVWAFRCRLALNSDSTNRVQLGRVCLHPEILLGPTSQVQNSIFFFGYGKD